MSELIEIYWISGSIDEARRVARYLVQERFVASAEIIPWVESIYMLNNQLETTQATKIILKTSKSRVDEVKEIIVKNSKYQIPEITIVEIQSASDEYLAWLKESITPFVKHK